MASGGEYSVGDTLMVKDKKDLKLYECTVIGVKDGRCKIHFKGWKRSHDEWLSMGDERIQLPLPDLECPVDLDLSGRSSTSSFVASLDQLKNGAITPAEVARRVSMRSSRSARADEEEEFQVSPGGTSGVAGHASGSGVHSGLGGVGAGVRGATVDRSSDAVGLGACAFCNCFISADPIHCRDCGKPFHAAP